MAWRSSGTSNEDLIAQLWKNGLVTDERVRDAFLKVLVYLPKHIIASSFLGRRPFLSVLPDLASRKDLLLDSSLELVEPVMGHCR